MYGVNAFIMPQPSSGEAGVCPVPNPKFVILIGTNGIFIHRSKFFENPLEVDGFSPKKGKI